MLNNTRKNLLDHFLLSVSTVFETKRDQEFYFLRIKKDVILFRESDFKNIDNKLFERILKDLLITFISRYDLKSVTNVLNSRTHLISNVILSDNEIKDIINILDLEILEYINGKRNFIGIKNIFNLLNCIH